MGATYGVTVSIRQCISRVYLSIIIHAAPFFPFSSCNQVRPFRSRIIINSPALPRVLVFYQLQSHVNSSTTIYQSNNLNFYIRVPLTPMQCRFPLGVVLLIQSSYLDPFLPGGTNVFLTPDPPRCDLRLANRSTNPNAECSLLRQALS